MNERPCVAVHGKYFARCHSADGRIRDIDSLSYSSLKCWALFTFVVATVCLFGHVTALFGQRCHSHLARRLAVSSRNTKIQIAKWRCYWVVDASFNYSISLSMRENKKQNNSVAALCWPRTSSNRQCFISFRVSSAPSWRCIVKP